MTRSCRYVLVLALIVPGALPLIPQRSGVTPADPVFRVTADLVQVDAVLTDSQGRHVTDLKREDFEILEDGKPHRITHFSFVPGTEAENSPGTAPARPPETTGTPAVPPAQTPRPEQVRRTLVMIADDLGLSTDDIVNVRRAMKGFIDRYMQPGDLVSVMTSSGGMGILAQLTNDKRQLYAAIDRIHYFPGRTAFTWYTPVSQPAADLLYQKEIKERLDAVRSPALSSGTFSALAYAIQGLREMPGRKAIAFFSDGFAQSAGGIVQFANRASVAIYALDPRGLVSFDATALDAGPKAGGLRTANAREAPYRALQASLDQLARGTGGTFFHDNNDLVQGLATALDDMGGYYLIGYQPEREDFEKVRGQPQFHRIEVKVLRAGLHVRSRNGFVGTPDPPAREPASFESGRQELRQALFSPFHSNGFPVHLSVFYSAGSKDPKTGRRGALLRAMLAIDAHGLAFQDAPGGKKQLKLDVVAAAYGENNEAVTSSDKTFSASMTADEMNGIVASGLVYGLDAAIPKPGPYQFRVAVRDANSGRLGSAATFVEIPDFNRPGILLSSLQLYDSDDARNAGLTRAGVLGAGSAVTRVFASGGAELRYTCTVYGPLTGERAGRPNIETAVNLFRGPEQILAGQPVPLEMSASRSTGPLRIGGAIRIPPTLPPGDYTLELMVFDRLEKKPRSAAQWIDFTLFDR